MPHFGNALFQWNDHNLVTYSEDFSTGSDWTQSGTPVLSSGQSDPLGGNQAWTVQDDDAAVSERLLLRLDANTHNSDGSKALLFFLRAGNSTASQLVYRTIATSTDRLNVTINWNSSGPSFTFTTGSLLWHRAFANSWWHVGFLSSTALVAASSHELLVLPCQAATAVGTLDVFGAQVADSTVAGSYVATYGTAISYSTASPAQSHSLQAPLRAVRPLVRVNKYDRTSLNLTHTQRVTVSDPRHGTAARIKYESDQESFHTFLAAAQRFPVSYIPSSCDLSDAHEVWVEAGEIIEASMDSDRGFPGFEDAELEIRMTRLDGQPSTGIYG